MWLIVLLGLAIVFIVVATTTLKLHPFLALLITAFAFGICAGMPLDEVVSSINRGFGDTIGYIGIVILAGSIIGTFLENSGGARRLAGSTLAVTGTSNVPLAMAIVGYVVSMPVFCDSGFVILAPMNKALARKAGTSLAAGAIALSLGLYATHTMVPPTPGPVAAAGILNADLGWVILYGLIVSVAALLAGWVFAVRIAARESVDNNRTDPEAVRPPQRDWNDDAPSTLKALMPILVPIILIVLRSIGELPSGPLGSGRVSVTVGFLGQPVVALLVGVLLSLLLPRRLEREMLSSRGWVGKAVLAAATIIVITGAGGAFGKVLQNSGIGDAIGDSLSGMMQLGIWLPFVIAAGIKTAQGSSTVAIITTASLVAPLLGPLGLNSEMGKALVVVAIGAGSMVVSHANDSYFWIVTQFSGMNVRQGYKLQTVGTLVEGGAAALTVWALSLAVL